MKSNAAAGLPEDECEDEWAAEGALREGCAMASV